MFDVIAFDADDTLWQNETLYQAAQNQFIQMISGYANPEEVEKALFEADIRNLPYFGYGIKGFALSMIETAVEVSRVQVQGEEIRKIIELAKGMVQADIQLFEHVRETLEEISQAYPLMIITKGDLLDQESKLKRSGVMDLFTHFEVVSDKTPESYAALLQRHHIDPQRFLMVGNSLRSDILPVTALGGKAVYIPYHLTWAHEADVGENSGDHPYIVIEHIGLLPDLLEDLRRQGNESSGA
jgi:putative hydrolase of the HAD superfamily